MSFVRIPGRSNSFRRNGSFRREKPRKPRKKDPWDDTVQDLTVHKATHEEMERRKIVHQSKNMDLVQQDKMKKKISKAKSKDRPGSNRKQQNAFLREVLYNQSQLEDVLAKSDQVMAVVKDLFGDDPMKYRGLPNVTVAPNKMGLDRTLPGGSTLDGPSKLDILSDSVMDKSALNDVETVSDSSGDESSVEGGHDLQYKPVLDLARFQKFLQSEQEKNHKDDHSTKLTNTMAQKVLRDMEKLSNKTRKHTSKAELKNNQEGTYFGEETPAASPKVLAMNDTSKIQRTMTRINHDYQEEASAMQENPQNLQDLKKVLDGLEGSIADYERQTGREPPAQRLVPNNFSGYTLSLVDAVSRLTGYLRESEIRLKAESTIREHVSQDIVQMRGLIDALTSDIITTQEEYAKLTSEFLKFRKYSLCETQTLRESLSKHGIEVPKVEVPSMSSLQSAENKAYNEQDLATHMNRVLGVPGQQAPPVPHGVWNAPDNMIQFQTSRNTFDPTVYSIPHLQPGPARLQAMGTMPHPGQQTQLLPGQQTQNLPYPNQTMPHVSGSQTSQILNGMSQQGDLFQHPQQTLQYQANTRQGQDLSSQYPGHVNHPISTNIQHNTAPNVPPSVQNHANLMPNLTNGMPGVANGMSYHPSRGVNQVQSQPSIAKSAPSQTSRAMPAPIMYPTTSHPAPAFQTAMLLSPPRQTDSPKVQGGKFQASQQQIQAAVQALKHSHSSAPPPKDIHKTNLNAEFDAVSDATQDSQSQQRNSAPGKQFQDPTQQWLAEESPSSGRQAATYSIADVNNQRGHALVAPKAVLPHVPGRGEGPDEGEQSLLAQQIAELNRQHAEAQSKLQSLMHHQQNVVQFKEAEGRRSLVSPPISPIPLASESEAASLPDTNQQKQVASRGLKEHGMGTDGKNRGITISLPQVDWSDSISPGQEHPHSGRTSPSPAQMQAGPKGIGHGGWFALSSHMTS